MWHDALSHLGLVPISPLSLARVEPIQEAKSTLLSSTVGLDALIWLISVCARELLFLDESTGLACPYGAHDLSQRPLLVLHSRQEL